MKDFLPWGSVLKNLRRFPKALEAAEQIASEKAIPMDVLLSRVRTGFAIDARVDLFQAIRSLGFSYYEIGFMLDRDHTAVLQALRRRAVRLEKQAKLKAKARKKK